MQRQHRHAEAGAEALQRLRRQPDFRYQHQRLSAGRQAVEHGLQVDLGLAAAGHALQQDRAKTVVLAQNLQGRALGRIQSRTWDLAGRGNSLGRPGEALGLALPRQRPCRDAPPFEVLQPVLGTRSGGKPLEQAPRPALPRPAGQRLATGGGQLPAVGGRLRQRLAVAQGDRNGGGQHLARGCVVVARTEGQGGEQLAGQQRRLVQALDDRLEGLPGGLRRPRREHHADLHPAPEGYPDAAPDPVGIGLGSRRRQVVEQARQGHRQGDAQYRCGGQTHGQSLAEPGPAALVD